MEGLADPAAVARAGIEHLADGPTWSYGMPDPTLCSAAAPTLRLRR
ncbi:MAG TPA: hypothetical protein VGJ03_02180 [Acidimicrobiales bacterium]